ncbi:M23 family metallopeptidase [Thermodesulfobacteriota bacterium]
MKKNRKFLYSLTFLLLFVVLFLFGWFLRIIFEGEKPHISFQPQPQYLSGSQKFTIKVEDRKRGLKSLQVFLNQGGRDRTVLEKKFPFKGFLNRHGEQEFEQDITVDPTALNLAQGRVDLNIRVWDYSRRGGGDGNLSLVQHKMTVDTIPPAIRSISRMHNVNIGGAGLVIYQASSDTEKSGLFVQDLFFKGFPVDEQSKKGIYLCYFAVPHDASPNLSLSLWAQDRAGNQTRARFYYHIRRKRFRRDKINVSDKFLNRVLPYFSLYPLDPEATPINKYIKINRELRQENNRTLLALKEKTAAERLWEGPWLSLKNAATMARYADHRLYYYKGEKVDEQAHLGIDLASLANSPVRAGNNGYVLFAEKNGIYGLTVVLDHGQGLATIYGHLSNTELSVGQKVNKGDIIGFTGQTGLAGGDHLHFGFMIQGVMVNPIEWWDGHWIEDNITKKLALLK